MRLAHRVAPYLAGSVLLLGFVAGVPAHAIAVDGKSAAARGVIGHLAYVTKAGDVDVVAVKGAGNTLRRTKIGPVGKPPAGKHFAIIGLQSSADGAFAVWQEQPVTKKRRPTIARPTLVLHQLRPSMSWTLQTNAVPIGFGGSDQLVVTKSGHSSILTTSPTPHLVTIPGSNAAVAVYPNGVVEINALTAPPGPMRTKQVSLLSFAGETTVIHNYVMSRSNRQKPEQAFVSADGSTLLVDRGSRPEVGGKGPSSLVDRFVLNGQPHPPRVALHHFGRATAHWRVGQVSFAGPNNVPWAIFGRAGRTGVQTAVAAYQNHGWRKILPSGIAVVGTAAGYAVVETGTYDLSNHRKRVTRVPDGEALLLAPPAVKVLGIGGSALAWVDPPN